MDQESPTKSRFHIGIGSLVETVFVSALCLNACLNEANIFSGVRLQGRIHEWFRVMAGSVFLVLSLWNGAALAVESYRGRHPSTWGVGRWIWSISAVFVGFSTLSCLLDYVIVPTGAFPFRTQPSLAFRNLFHSVALSTMTKFPWAIGAFCVTAAFTKVIHDPRPDLREFLGRIHASVLIGFTFTWLYLLLMRI
jgi:hypothetical protein